MNSAFIIKGTVIQGNKRGKSLGFPTANVILNIKIPEGIYAAEVVVDEKTYKSATFIGMAKTFNESKYQAESYLLNFNGDLYGKKLEIKLYKKIRENKKFDSEKELIKKMNNDVEKVKEFFKTSFVD